MDRSTFITHGNKIKLKGVQFPGPDAPDKISRGFKKSGVVGK